MTANADTTLEMTREFDVSVERLYEAWTDPGQVGQWMGPGEVKCVDVQIDLQPGGRYRIHMVSEKGDHIATGEYMEISQNKKLQFTWGWESQSVSDTLVTITFRPSGDGSALRLVHENFPDRDAMEHHTEGWNGCLAGLSAHLT